MTGQNENGSKERQMVTSDDDGRLTALPLVRGIKGPKNRAVTVEPGRGIEPRTYSLRVNRSAD